MSAWWIAASECAVAPSVYRKRVGIVCSWLSMTVPPTPKASATDKTILSVTLYAKIKAGM